MSEERSGTSELKILVVPLLVQLWQLPDVTEFRAKDPARPDA